ncbi:MAG TPA: tetratricopeptide repeat protein [Smithella sp.]|nr:tetratricopeptide repeat protein [Smithella sp.]
MKKKYNYHIIIFLIVTSVIAFSPVAANEFINFDDNGYITENVRVQQGITLQNVQWALTTTYFSYWHPLTWLSHMLDWHLFGANASGHHLMSLFLHIGSVIFLFLFLYKTTNHIWPAAFAAALFSLHPLRVESVAWASERKDVLNLFFTVLCFYAYAFYADEKKVSRYVLCMLFFVLAVMSKPMAVTLPFVLLLLDYWPLNRWGNPYHENTKNGFSSVIKLIGEKIPFFCLSLAASAGAIWAQSKEGTVASLDNVPFMIRTSNAIVAYVSYLGKLLWPVNLAVFYPYEYVLPPWKILFSAAVILVITLIVMYYIRKKPFLFVGWYIYLGTLVPVIGLVQVGSQAMADRYTYVPSLGITFVLAWGIPSIIENQKLRKRFLAPVAVIFLSLLMLLTWQQCHYWKNSVTVFIHAISVTKNNALAHNQLGLAFYEQGRDREALYHFDKTILLQPAQDSAYNNRGAIYLKYGRTEQALQDFNKTLAVNPHYVKAYNNRANLYIQERQYRLAMEDLNEAIRLQPDYVLAYFNRGLLSAGLGDYQKAIHDFDSVTMLNANHVYAYHNRASLYFNMGNIQSGCLDAQKACALENCQIMEAARARGYCR